MGEAVVSMHQTAASDALQVLIKGKLVEQRRNNGVFYSTVLRAAPDMWSQPMPFEIRSTRPLGQREDMVEVRCELQGLFKRTYDVTDRDTGEVRRVRPIVIALHAIEN